MKNIVYLIGAGPGDPGLLTIKADKLLRSADAVIYDSLINPLLLNRTKSNCELIFAGKKPGHKELTQRNINKLLISKANEGKKVVRLKGGDPFVFGRGGEEALEIVNSGIDIEIVPGVSSVFAVPAYSGIPITHRSFNSAFTVITGHQDPTKEKSTLDWKSISKIETLVFIMSLKNISKIAKKLLSKKMDPKTPVVVTSWGTYPYQKTLEGNISNIPNKISKNKEITSPAVIVIGKIADLRNKINWYEKKPLFGKKIVVTRATKQSSQIVEHLGDLGAQVIEFPTIEIVEPKSWTYVDRAIKNISKYNFVVFTSVNGVKSFFGRINYNNLDSRIFKDKTLIAIGEKTAAELKKYGLNADLIPSDYTAEGILSIIDKRKIKNKHFLIPRAKIARDLLPKKLKEYGSCVDTVVCYENIIPNIRKKDIKSVENLIKNEELDFITFTSSSTVNNFFKIINNKTKNINKIRIASIGPITDSTVQKNGFESKIVAKKYTIEGLVKAIEDYYS